MKTYLVERQMPGTTLDDLGHTQEATQRQVEVMRKAGIEVRYLTSTYVPEDGRCMCLFEAESADIVRQLNDDANLPYYQVVPVLIVSA